MTESETETVLATLERLEARIEAVADELAELTHIAASDRRVDAIVERLEQLAGRMRRVEQIAGA